ncbi:MAG: hypothetical protein H7263_00580, partial [Candidatus Sericytochromatia bacterium]|nr:hypothetical protein [Candidatus Sericytochromatia bacterium]
MKKVIKSISVNEAKKDMILANTIRDANGSPIFEKGIKLDYLSISSIKKEGVHYIYIYEFIPIRENIVKKVVNPFKKVEIKEEKLAENINDDEEEKYSVPASAKTKPPLKDVISIEMRKKGESLVKELFTNPNKIQ